MIDRKEYLQMCRECAMIREEGVFNVKMNVPDRLKVRCDGIEYYPCAYEISFDKYGKVRHTAILHDLKAHGLVRTKLEDVEGITETQGEA